MELPAERRNLRDRGMIMRTRVKTETFQHPATKATVEVRMFDDGSYDFVAYDSTTYQINALRTYLATKSPGAAQTTRITVAPR